MTHIECCSECKGSAPYFICRDGGCFCHVAKNLAALKEKRRPMYRDPTAELAVGRASKRA